MSKWSNRLGKILTAAGISAIIAVSSLAMPIEVSAARAITDDIMIRNDASREAGAIGSLQEGEEVTILDAVQSADGYVWYYIQLENGNTGYVRSDLIEASDEELAAINAGQPEENTEQEQEPEEEEKKEEAAAQTTEEKPAEQPQEAATAATAAPSAQTQDGEYDATKDPNAKFRVSYDTDENGNGEWYVHNDDNGSSWKVSDIRGQEGGSARSGGVAGIWRTLAILFGILALALAAFVLFLLKSIRDGRSKTTRGRALEAAAAGRDDDDDDGDEFDENYFEDDDEEPADDEVPSDDGESEEEAAQDQEDAGEKTSEEKPSNTPDSTLTMDVTETEVTEIPTDEIEAAIAATTAQIEKNISDEGNSAGTAGAPESDRTAADRVTGTGAAAADADDQDDEEDGPADEDPQEEYADDDYVDEDYEDEDYEDEDEDETSGEDEDPEGGYEDEDYVDEDEEFEEDEYEEDEGEEDSPRGRSSRSSSKGGFFGFLKKMFGTDSAEDGADDGEDFDDYEDEPEEREFDEFKEYPEDIDLLPREDEPDEDQDPDDDEDDGFSGQGAETSGSERGRLSMQRVMKNVSYKEEEADFSDEDDDLSDSLFEDDDDMEYSFISNTRNKK